MYILSSTIQPNHKILTPIGWLTVISTTTTHAITNSTDPKYASIPFGARILGWKSR